MIRIARDFNSFGELATHISQYSPTEIEQFGLHSDYAGSTYRKAAKQLEQANQLESLVEATYTAVHALFWNGVPIPKPVEEHFRLTCDAGPAATSFSLM